MQHIVNEVVDTLKTFVNHSEQSIMLIEAGAEESLLLLKSLGTIEDDELSPDIFVSHTDGFSSSREYVDSLLLNQEAQLEAVNEQLEQRGEPLLEEFPAIVKDHAVPDQDRLASIVAHVRRIVQPERKVVWTFFPLEEVADKESYSDLLASLAADVISGKIENTKIIIRDPLDGLVHSKLPENEEEITVYRPGLDFDSIVKKIDEQSKNPHASPEERAQNTMLMAGVDVGNKDYSSALQRNNEVVRYFQESKQPQKESIALNNIGDVHYLQGNYPQSQIYYDRALTIAIKEEAHPLVIYQSINFGNALYMQQQYADSLIYYDSAAKLAAVNKALIPQIQALEKSGAASEADGDDETAEKTWNEAADICRENKYSYGLLGILERLKSLYERTKQDEKAKAVTRELESCKSDVEKVDPALLKAA